MFPDEQLTSFAKRILEDKEQVRRIYEKAENNLVVTTSKALFSFDKKKTTIEKIRQMNQTNNLYLSWQHQNFEKFAVKDVASVHWLFHKS